MRTKPGYIEEEVNMRAQAAFVFPPAVEVAPGRLDALQVGLHFQNGREKKVRLSFLKKLFSRCQKFLDIGLFYIHGLPEESLSDVVSFKVEYINKWYGIKQHKTPNMGSYNEREKI